MLGNQQETKDICRVGSSATIRSLSSHTQSELHWNQWLAGLIDGDGCLLVSKAGYASCEITMGIEDEHALMQIKQKLGGSVKSRASPPLPSIPVLELNEERVVGWAFSLLDTHIGNN